jgi:hypothetical protein
MLGVPLAHVAVAGMYSGMMEPAGVGARPSPQVCDSNGGAARPKTERLFRFRLAVAGVESVPDREPFTPHASIDRSSDGL